MIKYRRARKPNSLRRRSIYGSTAHHKKISQGLKRHHRGIRNLAKASGFGTRRVRRLMRKKGPRHIVHPAIHRAIYKRHPKGY